MTRRCSPRGFTLIELMVASIIIAMIFSAVTTSLHQLSRARNSSVLHLQATMRADAALNALRKNIISVIRSDDLYWTRLLLLDGGEPTPGGWFDRDEIMLFNVRLRPVRNRDYIGDGMEFETQFRIAEDDLGPVLWQRRDSVPDEYPLGGGVATPLVEGVVGVAIEAYDGLQWFDLWDSDISGLPWALRITVVASGHRIGEDPYDAPFMTLRTVVPIDRVAPPLEDPQEDETGEDGIDDEAAVDQGDANGAAGAAPGSGGFTTPAPGGRGGGQRGGQRGGNTSSTDRRRSIREDT